MAKAEDILRDAIIGTENEIFGDAFGKEEMILDETGDRSLEAMGDGLEGQIEPPDDEDDDGESDLGPDDTEPEEEGEARLPEDAKTDGKPEVKAETEEAPREHQGRVPAGRLREEAERARAAIAERDRIKVELAEKETASQKAIADLNAKFEALAAMQRQPNAPKQEQKAPETPPDLFEDPNAFVEHIKRDFQQQIEELKTQHHRERLNQSIESAKARHGDVFDAAWKALTSAPRTPENAELVRRMELSPNPGEALVTWHRRNETLREVGDDPEAYKARLAEDARKSLMADPEFRKQLLAEMRGEAMTGDNGRPRTETRLPKSLNKAPGGNGRAPNDLEMFDGSERATFDSAWNG